MFEDAIAARDAREGRTYTVRALDTDDIFTGIVIVQHVSLVAACEAWDEAWYTIREGQTKAEGAIIIDETDNLPACLIGLELGCTCPRCDPAAWEDIIPPCPPTTPTGTAPLQTTTATAGEVAVAR
jgi:hypothetical protein